MTKNTDVDQMKIEQLDRETQFIKLETQKIILETEILKLQAQKAEKQLKYWWLPTVMTRDFVYLVIILGLLLYI